MAKIEVGTDVLLPSYLGGGQARVILTALPVPIDIEYGPPHKVTITPASRTTARLGGRELYGVEFLVQEGGRGYARYAMVDAEDLRLPSCPTCGRPQ